MAPHAQVRVSMPDAMQVAEVVIAQLPKLCPVAFTWRISAAPQAQMRVSMPGTEQVALVLTVQLLYVWPQALIMVALNIVSQVEHSICLLPGTVQEGS